MELVTRGVRGMLSKIKNRERNGEAFYRSARSTLGKRIHKKLTEKTRSKLCRLKCQWPA